MELVFAVVSNYDSCYPELGVCPQEYSLFVTKLSNEHLKVDINLVRII